MLKWDAESFCALRIIEKRFEIVQLVMFPF